MPDLSTVCPELSVDAAVGGDAAADPATAAAATESYFGGDGAPIIPVECRWSGRVRAFEVQGAVPVTACPEARRGGERKSSSLPPPSSPAASLAPESGRVCEFYVNEGAIAVTAGPEARGGGGRKNSSSASLPPSAAVPAPASGRALEDYVDADGASLTAEAHHGGGKKSSPPLHSAATAVHAPAPGVKLEDYVNDCAVSVTAYPEARRSGGKKSSSALLPSSLALLPAPAPASDLMLEDHVNKGVVSVTAHPEVRRGSGKKLYSARLPLSAAAAGLALPSGRSLKDYVKEWEARKVASGASLHHCVLPFLTGAPKAVECRVCYKIIHPSEEIKCSVSRCEQTFHLTCVVEYTANFTAESFKCPQHGCMVCKQKMFFWRCGRCTVAAHTKCAPWPLIHLKDDQGSAICWRHPSNWLLQNENADLTNNIEEVFCRLPLPYVNEEFNIDSTIRNFTAIVCKPPSYTHIRRNVYLVKKKRADSSAETGCTNCKSDSVCKDDCECRGLSMSCSKSCHCSDLCSNKPFRKDKKIKIVKSEGCGWGAVALEPLEKGDFIIEYVGEVINDATCEQRLWDMKRRGDKNFYMCEISKDFTIDATFKGNTSRFLNHSCDPNCKLEKWQVEGETRVGVFASRIIEVGEPLTYDYRFVHFGEKVKCHCGAKSCQGYLGSQLKNPTQNALAAAALENKLLAQQGGCSPSRVKPETHLLPWTNCIEVPFNLRSKTKIDRLCWGRKRQRTSLLDPSSSSAGLQPSVIDAGSSSMAQLLWSALGLLLLASSVADAATANYTFTVQSMRINQLCNRTDIIAVNGQLPGPTIDVFEGDEVVVDVINTSPYNLTIHWHGVLQKLTPWADGPSMVTQCPIQPNSSYTYRFNVTGHEGTLWWHAHSSFLRATVYGPLIIRPRNGTAYPFPAPDQELPVVLGEWWSQNVVDVEKDALMAGQLPSRSDAFTVNGLTGQLYQCANETFTAVVQPNTTVLLRVINAALNTHLFFKVAGHNFTVVAVDACYTANYTTDTLVLAPGNTVDALVYTGATPGSYYMAVEPHHTLSPAATEDTSDGGATATGILLYNGTSATATPAMPAMPNNSDSTTASDFYSGLRGVPAAVPSPVDVNMTVQLGLGQLPCDAAQTNCSVNAFAAAMNGVSFRLPTQMSLLEAQFSGAPGVYTADFPDGVPPNGTAMVEGTKVRSLPYNSTVEVVLQNPTAFPSENHPIHLHGFNFFVLAQGLGTFTPGNTSAYNLVDPVARNTIAVPTGGWAVIRFVANNPGMWFFHCHLDAHVPMGLGMVFAVENGTTADSMLPPPPADLPVC